MRKIILITAAIFILGATAGCGTKKAYERGTVEGGVYRNAFFGFSMTIPGGMYVMPREEMDEMSGTMDSETTRTAELLLSISAKAVPGTGGADTAVIFNYNIAVTAEKIAASSGIDNNDRYAAETARLLERSDMTGADEIITERTELGGREFVKFTMGRNGVRQDIYAHYHGGYALIITASYGDETGRVATGRILSTICFD